MLICSIRSACNGHFSTVNLLQLLVLSSLYQRLAGSCNCMHPASLLYQYGILSKWISSSTDMQCRDLTQLHSSGCIDTPACQ